MFDSTLLSAKKLSVKVNISNKSFLTFCFKMFNFLMKA